VVVVGFAIVLYFLTNIHQMLAVQTGKETAEAEPQRKSGSAVSSPAEAVKAVDLSAAGSLQEYLVALGEKYDLASLTLATADGLVIGSTRPDPQEEAAEYSYLYVQGKHPEDAGVRLVGVSHRGETVVGIARSVRDLSGDAVNALEQDIRNALRQWI